MTPYAAIRIQRFDHLTDAAPSAELPLAEALAAIAGDTYRAAIETARRALASRGEDAYKAHKDALPQFTFGGTFAPTRAKAHLVQHSELCHADIDHLPDLATTVQHLTTDPHVMYCFTSPRGNGLKYGVRIPRVTNDDAYKHAWGVVAAAHRAAYGVTWDPTGKDISRLCFVSWDPACSINPDAQVYPLPPPVAPEPRPRVMLTTPISSDRQAWYAARAKAQTTRIIAESQEGGLHAARCRAAYLLGGYVGGGVLSYDEAYAVLQEAVEGHTKHLDPSLKTIRDCLRAGEVKPITLDALEEDYRQWKATRPWRQTLAPSPSLTSWRSTTHREEIPVWR